MNTNLQHGGRDREFVFTGKDFERVRQLIYEHAGISLNPSKQDMVYSRLARRLRATGIDNFKDYLALLESNNEAEWQAFVNSLTTNLTSFFREPHHFPLLAEHVLKQKGRHPISLWCSAASTGEEPYSMAMAMVDAFGSFTPPVTIVATDLDTNVLAKAEAGVYPVERIEKLSDDVVKRFFLRGTGGQAGFVRVRPGLRAMITFRQVNLLSDDWHIRGPLDGGLCRYCNRMVCCSPAIRRVFIMPAMYSVCAAKRCTNWPNPNRMDIIMPITRQNNPITLVADRKGMARHG